VSDLDRQLLCAVEAHDMPKIMALIKAGADVNYRDPNENDQCILSTALCRYSDFVLELIIAGASPNASPSKTVLPLHYAVWNMDYSLIKYMLVHAKADVNGISFMAPGEIPETALDAAYSEYHCQDAPGSSLVLDGIVALLKAYGGKCYRELEKAPS
jgi:ankyrin repeat protein